MEAAEVEERGMAEWVDGGRSGGEGIGWSNGGGGEGG